MLQYRRSCRLLRCSAAAMLRCLIPSPLSLLSTLLIILQLYGPINTRIFRRTLNPKVVFILSPIPRPIQSLHSPAPPSTLDYTLLRKSPRINLSVLLFCGDGEPVPACVPESELSTVSSRSSFHGIFCLNFAVHVYWRRWEEAGGGGGDVFFQNLISHFYCQQMSCLFYKIDTSIRS